MQRFNPELVSKFEEMLEKDECMVDQLWPHVAPQMSKRERARKAALITLASHGDKNGMRGRCHLLMHGPPGTGKTELRNWVRYNIRNAHGVGPKSSEAGLKGDASGDELTPGALSMSHGGVICIEELDKFSKSDRDALYEAMSEGEFEINQAEIRKLVRAEVRSVATCNDLTGFKPALRDRFDFVVEMNEYDDDAAVEITDKLTDNFVSAFLDGEAVNDEQIVPEYLRWIESYEPGAEDGLDETIKTMKNYLIRFKDGLGGGIREKQAWLRIAYTVARLNKRDMTADDFITAVELLYPEEPDLRGELEEVAAGNVDKLLQEGRIER